MGLNFPHIQQSKGSLQRIPGPRPIRSREHPDSLGSLRNYSKPHRAQRLQIKLGSWPTWPTLGGWNLVCGCRKRRCSRAVESDITRKVTRSNETSDNDIRPDAFLKALATPGAETAPPQTGSLARQGRWCTRCRSRSTRQSVKEFRAMMNQSL